MSNRLSREKINFLSKRILEALTENDRVEFLDDPNEIRLSIVRSIEEEMKLYDPWTNGPSRRSSRRRNPSRKAAASGRSSTGNIIMKNSPSSANSPNSPCAGPSIFPSLSNRPTARLSFDPWKRGAFPLVPVPPLFPNKSFFLQIIFKGDPPRRKLLQAEAFARAFSRTE